MGLNLWAFLAIATIVVMGFLIAVILSSHAQKMKELEVEAIKAQKTNVKNEVDDAVERRMKNIATRLEVLETIVTDRGYELNEKITHLNK